MSVLHGQRRPDGQRWRRPRDIVVAASVRLVRLYPDDPQYPIFTTRNAAMLHGALTVVADGLHDDAPRDPDRGFRR